ncbi:MAG: hypothetical protein AAF493_12615 [Pseudomonadota bacterium]
MSEFTEPLLLAVGLLALSLALFVLEVFVVSFGLLLVCAVGAAGGAIYFGFVASPAIGWAMLMVVPIIGFFVGRWGIAKLQRSKLVPQTDITGEAGYHHRTDAIGVGPGAIGVMVTPARPSGRAKFDGGECDVQVKGGALDRGASVIVDRIDGPSVFVVPNPSDAPVPSSNPN